jgi:hypothetical protein
LAWPGALATNSSFGFPAAVTVTVNVAAGDPQSHPVVGAPPKQEEAKKAPPIIGRYFWNTYQVLTTTYAAVLRGFSVPIFALAGVALTSLE